MTRDLWLRRASLVGALALAVLSVASLTAVAIDVADVRAAERARPATAAPATTTGWTAPPPLFRLAAGDPAALVSERLSQEARKAGLAVVSADASTIRPLGDGRRLVEMKVTATGDASALLAFANWVAVNRDAVRLSGLISRNLDGGARHEMTVLVVVA